MLSSAAGSPLQDSRTFFPFFSGGGIAKTAQNLFTRILQKFLNTVLHKQPFRSPSRIYRSEISSSTTAIRMDTSWAFRWRIFPRYFAGGGEEACPRAELVKSATPQPREHSTLSAANWSIYTLQRQQQKQQDGGKKIKKKKRKKGKATATLLLLSFATRTRKGHTEPAAHSRARDDGGSWGWGCPPGAGRDHSHSG